MALPKTFSVGPKKFEQLKALTEWYDAMPAGIEVGDRFHENVFDIQVSHIELLADDEYYFSHVELSDGKMIASYGLNECGDIQTYEHVEIVA